VRGAPWWAGPRSELWGLAVGGTGGVRRVLEMLRKGPELAMVLVGLPGLESVGAELVLNYPENLF
jgi:isopentenyl diphosphate isomerase/L-lactate dehydrogenase-like FMN-dependent dehydrogenase